MSWLEDRFIVGPSLSILVGILALVMLTIYIVPHSAIHASHAVADFSGQVLSRKHRYGYGRNRFSRQR